MPGKSITELKNLWLGLDGWVIGSAKSMDYVDPDFFNNKLCIGLNRVCERFPCRYVMRKDPPVNDPPPGAELVLAEWSYGEHDRALPLEYNGDCVRFSHPDNRWVLDEQALSAVGTDQLVVSLSTITTAIHLAAYMGCQNIIVCGHDGGSLDGEFNYAGYVDPKIAEQYRDVARDHFGQIMSHTRALRERLRQVYGCRVYSLNPFIGFGLDGHAFEDVEPGNVQFEKPSDHLSRTK